MQLSDATFTDYLLVQISLIAWRYFPLQPLAWKRDSHICQNTRSDANGFCIMQQRIRVNACDLSERCIKLLLISPVPKMERICLTHKDICDRLFRHLVKAPWEGRWKNLAAPAGLFCRNEQFRRDASRVLEAPRAHGELRGGPLILQGASRSQTHPVIIMLYYVSLNCSVMHVVTVMIYGFALSEILLWWEANLP